MFQLVKDLKHQLFHCILLQNFAMHTYSIRPLYCILYGLFVYCFFGIAALQRRCPTIIPGGARAVSFSGPAPFCPSLREPGDLLSLETLESLETFQNLGQRAIC